jgi:hypothetical protein
MAVGSQLRLASLPGQPVVLGQANGIEALDEHPSFPQLLENVQCLQANRLRLQHLQVNLFGMAPPHQLLWLLEGLHDRLVDVVAGLVVGTQALDILIGVFLGQVFLHEWNSVRGVVLRIELRDNH